jgi:trimeric autotransporter adhesin
MIRRSSHLPYSLVGATTGSYHRFCCTIRHSLPSLTAIIALVCFAFSPGTQVFGVSPAPDGGYAGENTAEGTNALFSLTTGIDNTAVGFDALFADMNGSENTAVGVAALNSNVSGNLNTAIGYEVLTRNTGNNNTAIGANAMLSNTSGHDNTAAGFNALTNNTIGFLNTAFGAFSLSANVDGKFNTALGGNMENNTSGSSNVAVGLSALDSNTTGTGNTATGINALFFNQTGSNNAATGGNALLNNTAANNSAHGAFALQSNGTGHDNTAQGFQSLNSNNSGSNNVAVGSRAGANLTTGSNNIDLGANVVGAAGEANTIRIGKQGTQKSTLIAGIAGTAITGSQVVVNSNGKLGVVSSSARFKESIKPMNKASEPILALKPVTFRYKEEVDPEKIPQFGLIAEEVEKVAPDLVVRDEDGKVSSVRYEAVNSMLLNEFIKEHAEVQNLKTTIAEQQKQIEALTATVQKVSHKLELPKSAPGLPAKR